MPVELYPSLKIVHLTSVAISVGLFLMRGAWMLAWPHLLQQRWVKILPHIVDSVLLLSAIGLMLLLGQYPITHAWLTAKVVALLVYIALGSIALKRGRTRRIRIIALLGAVLSVSYMIAVARAHTPWPF